MSRQNVEIYRCLACGKDVVTVPEGFSLTEEELRAKSEEHLDTSCGARADAPYEERTVPSG